MVKDSAPTKGMKALSIVFGAFVCGFMWRCRGEGGFGSSWGLFSVGLVLMLVIYHFYGKHTGMKYEMIPIGALMLGLGVTGYATVIDQMSGTLWSDLPYQGEVVNAPIDPFSGMYIILIMGFTLVPLFSFFVGTLFSGKEYKIRHYVIAIIIFYAVSYIMKATLSHYILAAINPDQVDWAAKGLADSGIDLSPMQAYMKHFGDRGFSQDIPFNENYYMSIEHISDFVAVIAVALYPLIAFKDKISTFTTLFIDAFVAICTTACTTLMIAPRDTGFLANVKAPECLIYESWGLWEFCTGFSFGLFTMLALALIPRKNTENTLQDTNPLFANKKFNFGFSFLATVFIFGVVPGRVLGIRFARLLETLEVVEDDSPLGEIICAVLAVIFAAFILKIFIGNFKKDASPLIGVTPVKFAKVAFPSYIIMCFFAYFFLDSGIVKFPYSEMTSFSNVVNIMLGKQMTVTVMFLTFIIIMAIYIPLRKKVNEEH